MQTNSFGDRIKIDERICHGKPHIKGTRIHIDIILDSLASGETMEEIIESYPRLSKEDIFAALEYSSNLIKKEQILQGYRIHEKSKSIS
ncbi:DUF433 domain-containing protein [Candidatus Poribacteria bacterium]|nr:DUF433 domain-containing protein [Candidatus Poribacteria bacterium]